VIKRKLNEWIKRYLVAEIFALIGAVAGGTILNLIFHNSVLTALGGTWGENSGYYGYIISKDLEQRKAKGEKIFPSGILKVTRGIILEFGVAEYLDSFLVRPSAMYIFPKLVGNMPLGLIMGKFSADLIFYIPTIISYELKKKFLKD
jgi:hypothetical protein